MSTYTDTCPSCRRVIRISQPPTTCPFCDAALTAVPSLLEERQDDAVAPAPDDVAADERLEEADA